MKDIKIKIHSKLSERIQPVPLLQASPQQITSHLNKLAKLHDIILNDIQEPSGYYSLSESDEKNTCLLLVLPDKNGIHIKTGAPEQLRDNLEHTLPRLLQRIVRIEQMAAEESYDTTPDGDDIVIPATYLPAKEVFFESVFLNRPKPGWDFYLALGKDYSADDMVTFSLQESRKKYAMPMKRAVLYLLNDFLKALRHSIELDLSLLGTSIPKPQSQKKELTEPSTPEFYTPEQLAIKLNVSKKAITKWTQERKFPGQVKVGGIWRYPSHEIEKGLLRGELFGSKKK